MGPIEAQSAVLQKGGTVLSRSYFLCIVTRQQMLLPHSTDAQQADQARSERSFD